MSETYRVEIIIQKIFFFKKVKNKLFEIIEIECGSDNLHEGLFLLFSLVQNITLTLFYKQFLQNANAYYVFD